jgi:hypothetical protein
VGAGFLDRLAEGERAIQLAVVALRAQHTVAVFHVFLVLHFRADRHGVTVDGDIDVFLLHAGHFGAQRVRFLVLGHVHAELRGAGRCVIADRAHEETAEQVVERLVERIKTGDVCHFGSPGSIRRSMRRHPKYGSLPGDFKTAHGDRIPFLIFHSFPIVTR